jgi:acyl-CoA thioester hydrolase
MQVEPGWIDYNGHMNMAFYSMLFDRAAAEFYTLIGFGPDYARERQLTTYTAEFHVRYLRELHLGQQVRVRSWLLDHDTKRFHTWQEIWTEAAGGDESFCAATGEGLALHVDMSGPRVAPFPADIARAMDAFAAQHGHPEKPAGAGQAIGIPR